VPDKKPGWGAASARLGLFDKAVALDSPSQMPETLKLPLGHPPVPDFATNTRDTKNDPLNFAPNVPVLADPNAIPPPKAPDRNLRSIRIYALGSILSGTKEEVAEKEDHFQRLLAVAFEQAGLETGASAPGAAAKPETSEPATQPMPDLSFHLELRALVARGTAAQHEIIEQVMKALKENEKQSTTPTAPITPPALPPPAAPSPLRVR